MNKKKPKMKTANKVLIIIAIVLVTFTISCLWIFTRQGAVPDTLIVSVFGACLGEFSILGYIRGMKQKYPDTDDDVYEEE